jgi:DNA-binding response OmpR family regulator
VITAPDGAAGLRALANGEVELVVSDVNMPLVDGFALCRKLRQSGSGLPLILLTSRDSDIDEALGLDVGADDYVTKPFSTRVLMSRVAALLRRSELRRAPAAAAGEAVRRVGKLELAPERVELRYAGTPIEVTVTEFRLRELLASRPGVVFSRESAGTAVSPPRRASAIGFRFV